MLMNKKVLLIDDEVAIQEVAKIIFDCEGYSIQTLGSGKNLMRAVSQNRPDIILLDFSLPGQTGDAIAKKLKSFERTRNIPIIMISAHHALEQLAKNSGVNAFLAKPFSLTDLLSLVSSFTSPSLSAI